jgi:hypothetical protein
MRLIFELSIFVALFSLKKLDILGSKCYSINRWDGRDARKAEHSGPQDQSLYKGYTQMTPIKQAPIQKTIFDLDSMEEVLLVKPVPDFIPAENSHEVLARVGNDTAKMLKLLNDGLRLAERAAVAEGSEPWHTFIADENGELTDDVNGVFTGTIADTKAVNALKLTLAKTVFGFAKSMSKEEKSAAKESALEMIKTTPAIKAGLQKSAAIKKSADTTDEV